MEGDPGLGTPTGQLTESGLLSTNCPLILLTLAINFTGHPRGVFVSRFLMVPEKICRVSPSTKFSLPPLSLIVWGFDDYDECRLVKTK